MQKGSDNPDAVCANFLMLCCFEFSPLIFANFCLLFTNFGNGGGLVIYQNTKVYYFTRYHEFMCKIGHKILKHWGSIFNINTENIF